MTADITLLDEQSERPGGSLFYSPLGLFRFQQDATAQIYCQFTDTDEPVAFVLWATGIGKQQAVSEPVLTPSGWSAMGTLRPGDEVIGADGLPATVRSIHPQSDRTTYRVTFSDKSWTRCGPDHLWTVSWWGWPVRVSGERQRRRLTETLTLRQILDRGVKTPAGRRRFSIPIAAPVQYPEADLPLDPYAFGVVLGDGTITSRGYVSLTTDKEIIDALGVPGAQREHRSEGIEVFFTTHWKEALLGLGLAGCRSWEKFIPEMYLRAHESARRALLAGLLDTDGFPMGKGGVEYSTTSESLADAVRELAESLGGQGRKSGPRITSYPYDGQMREGRPSWRVNVKMPQQPHRLTRKMICWVQPTRYPVARWIESIERVEDEDSVCIKIDRDDGLYLTRHHIVTHNTILTIATACLMVEDDLLDQIVVVAEAGKVTDWAQDDVPGFSSLSVGSYTGTPKRRAQILTQPPQVLVMTYETGRNDVCTFRARSKAITGPGPLAEFLVGKRTLLVFDEVSRLRTRTSKGYLAWNYLVNKVLRKAPDTWLGVMGLTGTSVERAPSDHWNAGRILAPWRAGSVDHFTRTYEAGYDAFGTCNAYKNLTPSDTAPGVTPLSHLFGPVTLRKRKTDPDVIDQFPAKVEKPPTFVDLSDHHKALYDEVESVFAELTDPYEQRQGIGVLRQLAGLPASLASSSGTNARKICEAVGADYLLGLGSAKVEAMLSWQEIMADQQTVIFTFFGQSILPSLNTALRHAGYTVSINHGQMSADERRASQDAFKAGDTQIFLSSDAGARGLNLGMGSGLLHYELPLLWSSFVQRSDRIHRIVSKHPSVTIDSLIARHTIEEPLSHVMLRRNAWSDKTLGDDEYFEDADPGEQLMSAEDRVAMFRAAKKG